MVFPGSFPEPTIPEENPSTSIAETPKDGVTVLPKVEEDEPHSPQHPPSTAETVKGVPAPPLKTAVEHQGSPESPSTTSTSNA
ncbi:hypothetical protein I7I51_01202 [Histoplasma capsulatum]|uniref:Uncharacterized protein n=1 Tax=Ajellomyces capsulatus TaxID=5037 RepID=A0A8A1MC34_AJECA|nr:hypothetical protein I7I51_01202 [Histoplasma capsulatum]